MGSESPAIAGEGQVGGWKRDGLILSGLWLAAAVCDRLWLWLDHSVPAWDQGDHLSRALDYWQALQHPQFFAADWWWQLWQLSPSYRGPWVYLLTVPWLNGFGLGFDQATLVNLVFTALIMLSLYLLGRSLFSRQVGVWAAGLSLLAPALAYQRTDYLLDYGLTAIVTATFTCLTLWWVAAKQRWAWSIGWGLGLGCVLLTKPTGVFFLLLPCLYLLVQLLLPQRDQGHRWQRLAQFGLALLVALLVALPWFRTNWLTIITSALGANAVGAREGDPGNTLAGWLYYGQQLPEMVSWPVLYLSLGGGLLVIGRWTFGKPFPQSKQPQSQQTAALAQRRWLAIFCLGAYAFCSLATNKDNRFILPYLPIVILVLTDGLTLLPGRWGAGLRWGAVGLASLTLLVNLFPLPLPGQHRPYTGPAWPHRQVVAEVQQQAPYLRSTIGLNLASPQVNAFTFDFFGKLQDFQVYAREPDWSAQQVKQNSRSWDWYLTKTSQPLDLGPDQLLLQAAIEASPDLSILKTWDLPDRTRLRLHQRRRPPVVVQPLASAVPTQVELAAVKIPAQAKPGQPVPVIYQVVGPWQQLQNGILVLTWQRQSEPISLGAKNSAWIHDHGIGLGNLLAGAAAIDPDAGFEVIESLAMLPPADLPPGTYQLSGQYLNRLTGKTTALSMPQVTLKLAADAPVNPAPELDWSSQLRQLTADFQQGKLDSLFSEVARINLYDPTQDYLSQTAHALSFRLEQQPDRLDWWYNLALAQALQINPAVVQTGDRLPQLDPNNFYAWAYAAVVHLYFWQPWQAQTALTQAEKLSVTPPEQEILQILQGATALMQFNPFRAWAVLSPLIKS